MTEEYLVALLGLGAMGSGVLAGLFIAFSAFIMRALAELPGAQGAAAMCAINTTIVRSIFLPLFFGTTLLSVVLLALALMEWDRPGAGPMLVGASVYFFGMFLCTMVFNVPLNNELAQAHAASDIEATWSRYRQRWTRWNHLRAVASTAACGLFVAAMLST